MTTKNAEVFRPTRAQTTVPDGIVRSNWFHALYATTLLLLNALVIVVVFTWNATLLMSSIAPLGAAICCISICLAIQSLLSPAKLQLLPMANTDSPSRLRDVLLAHWVAVHPNGTEIDGPLRTPDVNPDHIVMWRSIRPTLTFASLVLLFVGATLVTIAIV